MTEMMKRSLFGFMILFLLFLVNYSVAQDQIIGRVVDDYTRKPIKDAAVLITSKNVGLQTNHLGYFQFAQSDASDTLVVQRTGYHTQTFISPRGNFQVLLKRLAYYRDEKGRVYTEDGIEKLKDELNQQSSQKGLSAYPLILNTTESNDSLIHDFKFRFSGRDLLLKREWFVGRQLTEFSLQDIDGNVAELNQYKGQPMMINFWFTACPPCVAEIPELNRLKALPEYAGVKFLAITFDDTYTVRKFLKKKPFDFRHLVNASTYCNQFTQSYPTSIFVDKDGVITEVLSSMPMVRTSNDGERKLVSYEFVHALNRIK